MSHRARDLAARVRERLGLETPPANASLLLAYAPIDVVHVDWPQDLAGVLVLRDGRVLIGLNRRHSAGRRHFSFWHEVGHYVLHRGGRPDGSAIACGSLPSDSPHAEREADAFATEVLMPEAWVRNSRREARDVAAMARRLRVSPQAMARRLRELGITPPRPARPCAAWPRPGPVLP